MAGEFRDEFFFRERIELFEKDDRGARVFSLLTLGLEFVADLAGADQDAVGFSDFRVRDYVQEILVGEVFFLEMLMGEEASGWRSMLFGVKTTSGFRQWRRAWRRNR